MTDRELLALAAEAHGSLELIDGIEWIHVLPDGRRGAWWNPLTDDGDALRLAVKLGLYISNEQAQAGVVTVAWGCDAGGEHLGFIGECAPEGGDDYAATRRAIVRAAAEIGRASQAAEERK